jgi:hypothetical protein
MTNTSGADTSQQEPVCEALVTLAEYLELSLDAGGSLIIMRHTSGTATLYTGNAEGPREDLKPHGTTTAALANGILEATQVGANLLELDGRTYRFFRSFAHIGGTPAVVFSAS